MQYKWATYECHFRMKREYVKVEAKWATHTVGT